MKKGTGPEACGCKTDEPVPLSSCALCVLKWMGKCKNKEGKRKEYYHCSYIVSDLDQDLSVVDHDVVALQRPLGRTAGDAAIQSEL